jgi:hypothetical protein
VSVLLTAIVAVVGVAVYVGLFVGAILLTLGYLLRQAEEAGPGPCAAARAGRDGDRASRRASYSRSDGPAP